VLAPKDNEVVGAPTLPNEENGVFVVCLLAVAPKLPKLVVVDGVVEDGQPPRDVPKPNCGLLKIS